MLNKSKCFTDVMKKHFNKKVAMTKKDEEDFENSTKCWIRNNAYVITIKMLRKVILK